MILMNIIAPSIGLALSVASQQFPSLGPIAEGGLLPKLLDLPAHSHAHARSCFRLGDTFPLLEASPVFPSFFSVKELVMFPGSACDTQTGSQLVSTLSIYSISLVLTSITLLGT